MAVIPCVGRILYALHKVAACVRGWRWWLPASGLQKLQEELAKGGRPMVVGEVCILALHMAY
jgi:hypothetical protein